MPKKSAKRQPLVPPGPFSLATTAAVAGAARTTVRSWTDPERGWKDPREMWPSRYGVGAEHRERRRKVAEKLRADLVAAGDDASWVDDTLRKIEQPSGPKEYADVELLAVAALAELTRHGFSPSFVRESGGGYLLAALTRELAVRAFIVPAVGDREPRGPATRDAEGGAAERYLAAERRNSSQSFSLQGLTPRELLAYFQDSESRAASTMWTVIDCDALLDRIVRKLDEVTRGEREGAAS
jgi:hypothetical protein